MNLGELTAQIQDDLIDERLTTAQVQDAIKQAIEFYSRRDFFFNNPIFSFPIVVAKEEYTVADQAYIPTLHAIKRVVADLRSSGYGIRELVAYNIQNQYPIYPTADNAIPAKYTYYDGKLRLTPASGFVGTLIVIGFVKFPVLTSTSSSDAWTTEAVELIRASAKRRLALNIFHDLQIAEACVVLEKENLEALERETARRQPEVLLQAPIEIMAASRYSIYDIRFG